MAGCLITTGITRSDSTCDGTFGGLLKVYLGNKSLLSSVSKNSSDVITGITMTSSGKAYEFQFEEEAGSGLDEELQADSGGFVLQKIGFTLQDLTQEKRQVLSKLKRSRLFAIVQQPDNTYWLVGETGFGLKPKTLTISSGTAATDIAQATVALEGVAIDYADQVLSSAISSIIV
jgi:hypothetical protein